MHAINHLCHSLYAFSILVIMLSLDSHAVCEIFYVVGLEGVGHHGFFPVLQSLFIFRHMSASAKKKEKEWSRKTVFSRQIEIQVVKSPKLLENWSSRGVSKVSSATKQENHLLVFFFLTANSFQNKRKETCHRTKGNARQRTSAREERPVQLTFTDVVY